MPILEPYSVGRVLEKLTLDKPTMGILRQILDLAEDDGRIPIKSVIDALFSYMSQQVANNVIRNLANTVNKAAAKAGVQLTLQKSNPKKAGLTDRWLWFEAPESTPTHDPLDDIGAIDPDALISGQRGYDPDKLPKILLLTFNQNETQAVLQQFLGDDQTSKELVLNGITYTDLGVHGRAQIYHSVSGQGESKAQLSATEGIEALKLRAVIGLGVTFGIDQSRQHIGDVLVSTAVYDYELKKVKGGKDIPRGKTPEASHALVQHFTDVVQKKRSDGTDGWPRVEFGVLLSGNSLIDDLEYRNNLVELAGTEIIGGEMEAYGIHEYAAAKKVDWIIVKGICDWADGNKQNSHKERDQQLAAKKAAMVVHETLSKKLYDIESSASSSSMLGGEELRVSRPEPFPDPDALIFKQLDEVGQKMQNNLGIDFTLVTDLDQTEAEQVYRSAEAREIMPVLHEWVMDPHAPSVFALLGEYGMGKTVTCQRLTQDLRKAREENSEVPLALYFNLQAVTRFANGVPSLDDIVEEVMANTWGHSYKAEDFRRWVNDGAIIIFDGLDEVLVNLTQRQGQEFTRRLLSIIPLNWLESKPQASYKVGTMAELGRKPRVLVSCRTHYFPTLREQQHHFTGPNRGGITPQDFRAMVLLPFTDEQIRSYLQAALPDEDPDRLIKTIREIHNLSELAERPFLLSLIAQFIPKLENDRLNGHPVYGVTLYRHMVEDWLEKDLGRHQLQREDKLPFASFLAARMWQTGQSSLPAQDVKRMFQAWLDTEPELRGQYANLPMDRLNEDLRTATFLVRHDDAAGNSSFRFAHTSLQEYFQAIWLRDAIVVNAPERWAMPTPSRETLIFLGQLFAEANNPHLLDTLGSWRHEYRKQVSDILFAYALLAHSLGLPVPALTGIKLPGVFLDDLTIKHSRPEAHKLDLTGAVLTGASLRRAAFDHVIFDHADFSGAILTRAYFHQCSLMGALWNGADASGAAWKDSLLVRDDMQDACVTDAIFLQCSGSSSSKPRTVHLRQQPELQLSWDDPTGPVGAVAYSPDGARLATASRDGIAHIWDTTTGECLTTLTGLTGPVAAIMFSPDGARLAPPLVIVLPASWTLLLESVLLLLLAIPTGFRQLRIVLMVLVWLPLLVTALHAFGTLLPEIALT